MKSEHELALEFPQFKYEITDDFIGVFDGLFPANYCEDWRNYFDRIHASGYSQSRSDYQKNVSRHEIDDESISAPNGNFYIRDEWRFVCPRFNDILWRVVHRLYSDKFSILKRMDVYKMYTVKMQMTRPGGGYHVWHSETESRDLSNRILAFTLFLNTINDGGETEFLYQKKRISPVEGRMLIWPAGFTHVHRGNPPLKENKYIATGWLEY